VLIVCAVSALTLLFGGHASAEAPASLNEHADAAWRIVVVLLGGLQTILMGIAIWMINNIRELFTRTSKLEGNCQTLKAVCDERHKD